MENNHPANEFRDMFDRLDIVRQQIQESHAKLQEIDSRMKASKELSIYSALGERRADIERDSQSALREIDRMTPTERRAVVALISDVRPVRHGTIEHLRQLVLSDIDVGVRTGAIYKLGKILAGTHDREVVELCFSKMMCTCEHLRVRKSAYYSILILCGENIVGMKPPSQFTFPDDVDWSLVEKELRGVSSDCRFLEG